MELVEEEPNSDIPGFAKPSQVTCSLSEATGLLVVDVSNLAYRSCYAYHELKNSAGVFSGHVFGSVSGLLSTLRNSLGPGKWCVVFCYDGPGAKAERQKIAPEYKADREKRFNPIPEVKEVLIDIPGIHIEHPSREGDDAIAWAVERMARPDRPIVILSGDRDLWGLMRFPGVQVYSPNKKRMVTPADLLEAYAITDPGKIYLAKAMFGDAGDNIRGAKGLRKAQVAPHLNRVDVTNVSTFFDAIDLADKKTTTLNTKALLANSRERIENNLKVITPNTSGFDASNVIKTDASRRISFASKLANYDCKSLVDKVDSFYGTEFYGLQGQEDET